MYRRDILRWTGAVGAVGLGATGVGAARRPRRRELGEPCNPLQEQRVRWRDDDAIDAEFEITDVEYVDQGELDDENRTDVRFESRSQVTITGSTVPSGCRQPALDFVDYHPSSRELMVAFTNERPYGDRTVCIPETQRYHFRATVAVPGQVIEEVILAADCETVATVPR